MTLLVVKTTQNNIFNGLEKEELNHYLFSNVTFFSIILYLYKNRFEKSIKVLEIKTW